MIKVEPKEGRPQEETHKEDLQQEEMREERREAEGGKNKDSEDPYLQLSKEELVELIKKKDEELAALNDKFLRLAAEMDNTRKRLEREREEAVCYANEQIIRELLPVIDNLERAVQHANENSDIKTLLEGVKITLKSFISTLERFGCKPFDSVGKPFDPAYHEAIMQQESKEHPENTVVQEYQRGYILKDRLLRPAMVVVSKAPKESGNKETENADEGGTK